MKAPQPGSAWFFVDESGDPTFYDRSGKLLLGQAGCDPLLLLGFVRVADPEPVRRAILQLQREVVQDPYFQDFPSLAKTAVAFHATDDVPEIRYRVFKLLAELDFQSQFIVARKIERVFKDTFQASEGAFYDHLVATLFERVLHTHEQNFIYIARRGSRARQLPLNSAIEYAIKKFQAKWKVDIAPQYTLQVQTPSGEPCLSIVDYMNWAVHRAFTRGEMRYYRVVAPKVSLLVDLYDSAKYPKTWYNKRNPFDAKKITPL